MRRVWVSAADVARAPWSPWRARLAMVACMFLVLVLYPELRFHWQPCPTMSLTFWVA